MTTPRYTDARVPDPGIAELFAVEHRWQRWLDVEAALAAAEAEVGIVPPEAADAIAAAAFVERLGADRITAGMLELSHPLMAMVTRLGDEVGDPHGGWVHWGATTENITHTGNALVLREVHQRLTGLLEDLLRALADLAGRTAELPAAGRTHGQHAVPITFGFKVAGWIDQLIRHRERLGAIERRAFTAMVGGAVGNFASLGSLGPAVQAAVARRLDLEPMPLPSRAVVDSWVEYVCLLGLLAGTGGRVAGEVFTLMRTEFAEAAEPAPVGTVGSSTMPHKRNPQLADDCVAISAQVRAIVPQALEAMLHDGEVDGGHSALLDDAVQRACVLSGDLLTRLVVIAQGLEVDGARLRANLDLTGGQIVSERIMLALGERIGRQVAHEVVYAAARSPLGFAGSLRADERVSAHVDNLDELLDPASYTGLSAQLARDAADRARAAIRAAP